MAVEMKQYNGQQLQKHCDANIHTQSFPKLKNLVTILELIIASTEGH